MILKGYIRKNSQLKPIGHFLAYLNYRNLIKKSKETKRAFACHFIVDYILLSHKAL